MTRDDEVATAFDIMLEVIKDAINTLNQDGAEAFRKGDYDQARDLTEKGSQMTAFRDKVTELQQEWANIFSRVSLVRRRRKRSRKAQNRLGRGLKTRQDAFRVPILRALVSSGGSAPIGEVLDKVGQLMEDALNQYDRLPLSSTPDSPRWRNTVQWARNAMVKEGLLASDSPRGVWEITAAGKQWLEGRTHKPA